MVSVIDCQTTFESFPFYLFFFSLHKIDVASFHFDSLIYSIFNTSDVYLSILSNFTKNFLFLLVCLDLTDRQIPLRVSGFSEIFKRKEKHYSRYILKLLSIFFFLFPPQYSENESTVNTKMDHVSINYNLRKK